MSTVLLHVLIDLRRVFGNLAFLAVDVREHRAPIVPPTHHHRPLLHIVRERLTCFCKQLERAALLAFVEQETNC